MNHESDIISSHKQEAAELALELYNINLRRNHIEERLNEIAVILNTAEYCEKDKKLALEQAAAFAEEEKKKAIQEMLNASQET